MIEIRYFRKAHRTGLYSDGIEQISYTPVLQYRTGERLETFSNGLQVLIGPSEWKDVPVVTEEPSK